MKKPVCPPKPIKPSEPSAPLEFYDCDQSLYIGNGNVSLKDLIAKLPAGVSPDDLFFVEDYYSNNEYDGTTAVCIFYKYKVKNTQFKSEQKKYEKRLIEYPKKLNEYETKMISYEPRLLKYQKNLEAYELAEAKKELRRAEYNLAKLIAKK